MIKNVTNKPVIKLRFAPIDTEVPVELGVSVEIVVRGKGLFSNPQIVDPTILVSEAYLKLLNLTVALSIVKKRLKDHYPQLEIMKNQQPVTSVEQAYARNELIRRFEDEYKTTLTEQMRLVNELWLVSKFAMTTCFMEWLLATPMGLYVKEANDDDRSYALCRGAVWACRRSLEIGQWDVLVDRLMKKEDAKLGAALAEEADTSLTRERISPEVRRAVWIRDQGKCSGCGNRERLEFDHIVPVSRGGSNTARNIELLCEVCNRAKSDSIT